MEVKFLKAFNGDAIHLSFTHIGQNKNILIDGGMPATYSQRGKKGKIQFGALKTTIDSIRQKNEVIDLLILTHVDQDHIGGILKWFKEDRNALDLVNKVWFHSGRLIKEAYETQVDAKYDNSIELSPINNTNTSIAQGVTFEAIIESKKDLWLRKLIKADDRFSFCGLDFIVLSPDEAKLKLLLGKWKQEDPGSLDTAGTANDYNVAIKDHVTLDTSLEQDKAVHNGSSISFIICYKGKNFVFLADAHPNIISKSLLGQGYSALKPLKAEFIKLSHHGSIFNNSREMLTLIDSNKYVISTNGKKDSHPHKRLLARLINKDDRCTFYFNYPELIDHIFSEKDRLDFPDFQTLSCEQLDLSF